jgi:hypothetical protein
MVAIRIDVYHHVHEVEDSSTLGMILNGIHQLEKKMSLADDKITQFKADVDAKFAVLSGALDNIAADEARILAQLQTIPPADLSPESQSTLAAVVTQLTAMADRSQTLADSIPDPSTV